MNEQTQPIVDEKKNKEKKQMISVGMFFVLLILLWIVFSFLAGISLAMIGAIATSKILDKKPELQKFIPITFVILIVLILGAIFIPAMQSDKNSSQTTQTQQQNGGKQIASRCLDVPANALARIDTGLTNGKAVRSNDFEKVYFVSAYLQGEGLSGTDIATFATNNLDGPAFVLAVDSYAKEFTVFPASDREGAQFYITLSDDGARESRDCVSQ